MVQGGYNAVLVPPDSLEAHFLDTLKGGGWINDQELAWTLVTRRPAACSSSRRATAASSTGIPMAHPPEAVRGPEP